MSACCPMMGSHSTLTCGEHTSPHDCPDVLVVHTARGAGLPVRDGGSSMVSIRFCPWCGSVVADVPGNHRVGSRPGTQPS